mmetsp:Transcript_19613/g.61679  ORF Transcript_19613/g.61679 Transcript_19613/m.61679 type:complete len:279 (-) Transcript_19613:168-1004(-)
MGDGVGRSEEELLEGVDGGEVKVLDVCLGRHLELGGLGLAHDESGGGAVGEKARVRRGVRPVRLDEGGLKLGELLGTRDANAVLGQVGRERRDELVRVETGGVRLGRLRMRPRGVLVLRLPGDAKFRRETVRGVPHDLAGRVVGDLRRFGREIFHRESAQQAESASRALLQRLARREQALADGTRVPNRDVRERLAAPRQHDVRLPGEDLLGALTDRRARRDASHRHRVRRHRLWDPRVHRRLARDVRRPRLHHHRPVQHVVHRPRLEPRLCQQPRHR